MVPSKRKKKQKYCVGSVCAANNSLLLTLGQKKSLRFLKTTSSALRKKTKQNKRKLPQQKGVTACISFREVGTHSFHSKNRVTAGCFKTQSHTLPQSTAEINLRQN